MCVGKKFQLLRCGEKTKQLEMLVTVLPGTKSKQLHTVYDVELQTVEEMHWLQKPCYL
jgi:hypothetical protein